MSHRDFLLIEELLSSSDVTGATLGPMGHFLESSEERAVMAKKA